METIDQKRQRNIIDNEEFLKTLRISNLTDDLKMTCKHTTVNKKNKTKQKETDHQGEIRRSSRLKSNEMKAEFSYSDDVIDMEDDWKPLESKRKSTLKKQLKRRQAARVVSAGVKIFNPNIGRQASLLSTIEISRKSNKWKKLNVAISSSEED